MNSIFVIHSRTHQAWFLLFGDRTCPNQANILRIVNTREEAQSLLKEWGA